MSLLTKPRHSIIIQKRVEGTPGSLGQRTLVDDGDPFVFKCNIHPLNTEENLTNGEQQKVWRRIVSRTWPANTDSLFYLDGYEWEQDGDAENHDTSKSTLNVNVVIKRRGKKDAPSLQVSGD